jgi:hypothetical protein
MTASKQSQDVLLESGHQKPALKLPVPNNKVENS